VTAAVGLRLQTLAVAATFALLWGDLFLTADADDPTTWAGVITATAVLAVASLLALALVRRAPTDADAPPNQKAALTALAGALFGLLLFWTGAAVVLGVAVVLLSWPWLRPMAYTGAAIAIVNALYFPIALILEFAPGLPG
jgi:hypothetical protein